MERESLSRLQDQALNLELLECQSAPGSEFKSTARRDGDLAFRIMKLYCEEQCFSQSNPSYARMEKLRRNDLGESGKSHEWCPAQTEAEIH
jgi:hypothetical protein